VGRGNSDVQSFIIVKMYKQKNNNRSRPVVQKRLFQWIKRKSVLIISAFMIGMSNAIYKEDRTINGNQDRIEQEHDKD